MSYYIREMTPADYDAVFTLWNNTEQLDLNECDSREGIELYLKRNVGLCFVAVDGTVIVGNVLCGHDGRRGLMRHLAVAKTHRGREIARALVRHALEGLIQQGIGKCNIFVEDTNLPGFEFWEYLGWKRLPDTFRTLQRLSDPSTL